MKNLLAYYLKDALQGLRRNLKAFLATVILIAISLTLMGSFLLVKQSADGLISFLETQVKIKVFLDEGTDASKIEQAILKIDGVEKTEIETKEQLLERMKGFFEGKEYLFEAFEETEFPYTILVEAKDETYIEGIAETMTSMSGIQDVVYPQTFAKEILKWTSILDKYGIILLIVFLFISFLTTQLAISLSIHQRKKEIKLKLLLGAKASHVRGQFLFEGWVMAFVGTVLAALVVTGLERVVMTNLYNSLPVIFSDINHQMNGIILILLTMGSIVGIAASYLSTRGMMKDA